MDQNSRAEIPQLRHFPNLPADWIFVAVIEQPLLPLVFGGQRGSSSQHEIRLQVFSEKLRQQEAAAAEAAGDQVSAAAAQLRRDGVRCFQPARLESLHEAPLAGG